MKHFFLILFLAISTMAGAQCKISGTVKGESGESVIAAVITATNSTGTSQSEHSITDDKGAYNLIIKKPGTYTISVSCLGYKTQERKIGIKNTDTSLNLPFLLKEDTQLLDEVTVTGRRTGIAFRGDTVRYDTRLFKDGSEKVLGDVLNKLPGIEVDATGKVKSQGKDVDKVLFNGQDFFNGNSQVAVNNLPADIADNVEVINNYSEYSLLDGFQSHDGTAINIGVNKGFLGKLSGEVSAAYGIKNKYQYQGNLMKMGAKSMLSFIGSYNNTGAEVFSLDDYIQLQGGAKALVNSRNSNFIELSQEEKELLSPKNNVYARTNGLSSFNYSSQLSSKLKFNGYLLYNTKNEKSADENKNTYIIPEHEDLMFYSQTQNRQRTNFIGSNLNLKYDMAEDCKIDYKAVFSGNGVFKNSEDRDNRGTAKIMTFDKNNSSSFKMSHVVSFIKSTPKGLLTGDINGKYSDASSGYAFDTDSLLLPIVPVEANNFFTCRQNQYRKDYGFGANLAYTHKLGSFLLNGDISSVYTNQSWSNDFRNPESDILHIMDKKMTNETWLKLWDNSLSVAFSKKTGLFRFSIGGAGHIYNISTNPAALSSKNLVRFTPDVNTTLYFSPKNILKAYFNTEYRPLSPDIFNPGANILDYRSLYAGNDLKTIWTSRYNAGISYQFYDLFSNTMLFLTGGYTRTNDDVTYNYHTDGILSERKAVNSPDSYNVFGNFYLNKGLSIPLKLNLSGTYNFTCLTNYLDETENNIKINSLTGKFSITSNFDGFINAELYTRIEYVDNHSSVNKELGNQLTQHYGGELKLNFSNKLVAKLGAEQMKTRITDYTKEIFLFNGSIQYEINKKLTLSVKGQNMLNLRNMNWTTMSFDGFHKQERLFYQIPGNILFNISYKL